MNSLLFVLFSISKFNHLHAPTGTELPVRLLTPLSSYSTASGAPLSAVLIAPVRSGKGLLAAGASVTGRVRTVTRIGLGIKHECAALELDFNSLTLPEGTRVPIATAVSHVDNARESVARDGVIHGVRATGSISYRVSGYIRSAILWDIHANAVAWALRSLLVQLPEPEIYFPAGTELTLKLREPLDIVSRLYPQPLSLPPDEIDSLQRTIASVPTRTIDGESGRPSDPINMMLIGSQHQILNAFRAAGWTAASPDSLRSRIRCIRAAAEIHGFAAPMTPLLLNGSGADLSLQKGLNDVSKRHHIRIWKQPGSWHGKQLWMAAATKDVDFAYLRPGRTFTHRIDPNIDEEREKVTHDLEFTHAAVALMFARRPGVPSAGRNGSGDSISTDGGVVAVSFREMAPFPPEAVPPPIKVRGNRWQRFARREILVTRSDLVRDNIYWRSFEAARWAIEYAGRLLHKPSVEPMSLAGSSPLVEFPTREQMSRSADDLRESIRAHTGWARSPLFR